MNLDDEQRSQLRSSSPDGRVGLGEGELLRVTKMEFSGSVAADKSISFEQPDRSEQPAWSHPVIANGKLYLSTPIGRERVCFNAHRVFSVTTILALFSQLRLISFSYVDDVGQLHLDTSCDSVPPLDYGCGFFEFAK